MRRGTGHECARSGEIKQQLEEVCLHGCILYIYDILDSESDILCYYDRRVALLADQGPKEEFSES